MIIEKCAENGKFDLHLHTTASDGAYTPAEVVKMAYDKGVFTIAITDHDTIDGLEEAEAAGKALGIEVIKGVEISTKYNGKNIDILGYNVKATTEICSVLKVLRTHREGRAQVIVDKFKNLGILINLEDVLVQSQGKSIGRPHIAKAVVEKGFAQNVQEVFDLYLADGKACAVDKMILTPKEGISLIHEAGGIAVLAHPYLIGDDHLVEELLKLPFEGIEVWHRSHSKEAIAVYKRFAEKYNKIKTGGSDFHHDDHTIGEFGYHEKK
ncbi:PHP domain-containing protein [Cytobacillus firmus]|uniref:PHP domain-containing protein n=1 Tax=Cytobacillus firmus TaxID=1399 RepID=UPI0020797221|nr:PHP domain-containing protein [Cytobacillus firmus]USK41238.1 PHP domain-containing protein [Cytobacillus firmus]